MKSGETFATAFNCMDGRCQEAVRHHVRLHYGVTWVDMINEPGIDGILAGKPPALPIDSATAIGCIRAKAEISAKGHGSQYAVVVGHKHCAGNSVSDEEHLTDICLAVKEALSWALYKEVVGLMAQEVEPGRWEVSQVSAQASTVSAAA